MTRRQSTSTRDAFKHFIPDALLRRVGRESKAFERARKIDVVSFFWAIVLGFGSGDRKGLAGLRRAFESIGGTTVAASTFYERFTPKLVVFFKTVLGHAMEAAGRDRRQLAGSLAQFRDVLLADSTVLRLHDLLQRAFPGSRTNHSPAAAKLHVVYSVRAAGAMSVRLTSERVHDGPVLRAGKWVRDRLLIFDLGYYRFQLFDCIQRQGGYFITRLKERANPLITDVHLTHRGRAIELKGQRLQTVLERLRRDVLDVEVELEFKRRVYAGRQSRARGHFRVVGLRNEETKSYHLYVTNIPAEKMPPEDIGIVYGARWLIEIAFRQLKSQFRLDDLPSTKRPVVEVLLYAALITSFTSRELLAHLQATSRRLRGRRVPEERWAAVFTALASNLMLLVARGVRHARLADPPVRATLLRECVDTARARIDLFSRAQQGVAA